VSSFDVKPVVPDNTAKRKIHGFDANLPGQFLAFRGEMIHSARNVLFHAKEPGPWVGQISFQELNGKVRYGKVFAMFFKY
jgi:hypothetical protein